AVYRDQNIVLTNARRRGGTARRDLGHIGALEVARLADGFPILSRQRLQRQADIAALDRLTAHQLVGDGLGGRRRDGETDADRTARLGIDGRVDADHPAIDVEGRTAGIALVDGRVDLKIVDKRAVDL